MELADLSVGQFVSRPVYSVDVKASILNALKLMSDRQISCVVVKEGTEPVGILTERDIVFAANWVLGQPELIVTQVMNKPVWSIPKETPIAKACQIMTRHHIRHLVVLDRSPDMLGVFTQTDLVRALQDQVFSEVHEIATLMSSHVLTVRPDIAARYALSQMARRAVSCVVVVDNDRPVGVFTERDVVRLVAKGVDLDSISVSNVMSYPLVQVPQTTSPNAAIGLMQAKKIRRLLVVNTQSELVGILTQTDLGRVLNTGRIHSSLVADHWHEPQSAIENRPFNC